MDIGKLYIVATPIGNLKDITLRALEILEKVDIIACEDTRIAIKLLNHYNIKKPLVSCHQHSRASKFDLIIEKLLKGKNIAFVTDAGTPGISDAGNQLVELALKQKVKVVPIPGPSAVLALASVAGIDLKKFIFLGFPPHKKGRETFFKEVAAQKYPVIYFESQYRLIKNLEFLGKLAPEKKIIIGRELTKFFEEVWRGSIADYNQFIKEKKPLIKGEITIIVY